MLFPSYTDPELGVIRFRVNNRARHIVMRAEVDGVLVTVPSYCTSDSIQQALERFRGSLQKKRSLLQTHRIDWNFRLEAPLFRCSLEPGEATRFLLRRKLGEVVIVCPKETDFDREGIQPWLNKVVEQALSQQATALLLPRLKALSVKHGLPYEKGGIRASKGRWGSCSARKSIHLSCYVLLLPEELMEYVMLHELMHTLEMNHGERFWKGLNQLTDGRARELDKALNRYQTSLFPEKH